MDVSPISAGTSGVTSTPLVQTAGSLSSITFSYPGALDDNVESPRWYPPVDVTFALIRVSLLAAATSNHVISLKIDGVEFDQYTLTTSNATMTEVISCPVLSTESVTIETITVADFDLSVQLTP